VHQSHVEALLLSGQIDAFWPERLGSYEGKPIRSVELAETAGLLLDLARIQDGDGPRDPAGFARRVASALALGPG
jgi:HSP90 family molecular chaperone